MKKNCNFCEKEFEAKTKRKQFCSQKCILVSYYYRNREKILVFAREGYLRRKADGREQKKWAKKVKRDSYKMNARRILNEAVEWGKIKKLPCMVCGETKVHGHHNDHSKPLEVEWLCVKHHYEKHRKYKNNAFITSLKPKD